MPIVIRDRDQLFVGQADLSRSFRRWQEATGAYLGTTTLTERFRVAGQILSLVPRCVQPFELAIVTRNVSQLAVRFLERTPTNHGFRFTWTPSDHTIAAALETIRLSHTRPSLSLDVVSGRVAVSRFTLSRLVNRATGQRFSMNVHTCRVLHAALLLERTRLSVKEVAAAVGYAQTSDLDRAFNRFLSMTPGLFRSMATQTSAALTFLSL